MSWSSQLPPNPTLIILINYYLSSPHWKKLRKVQAYSVAEHNDGVLQVQKMFRPLNAGVYNISGCLFLFCRRVVQLHHGAFRPINSIDSHRLISLITYIPNMMDVQRDIRGDDGAVVISATFGLLKSSLTGNTCVSASERDVEWLHGWARVSARECRFAAERSMDIHPYRQLFHRSRIHICFRSPRTSVWSHPCCGDPRWPEL